MNKKRLTTEEFNKLFVSVGKKYGNKKQVINGVCYDSQIEVDIHRMYPQLDRINRNSRIFRIVRVKFYSPDFLLPNGMYLEVKGQITADWAETVRSMTPEQKRKIYVVFKSKRKYGNSTNVAWAKAQGFAGVSVGKPDERWFQ